MSRGEPVWVTGAGAVSAWGWGVEPLWQGLAAGTTAIRRPDRFDSSAYRTRVAGEVPDPPAELAGRFSGWSGWSWADRFAVAAAREALDRAGLGAERPAELANATVVLGSSTGGMLEGEEYYEGLRRDQRSRLRLITRQLVSSPGEVVARELGCSGPVETVSSACASGTLALGMALERLRAGEADIALAGGSDGLCRITYGGFNALRLVDDEPCRPFRRERAGLSIGEGSGILVLETASTAAARGATPLAILSGAGASSDAHHMTAPHPEGEGAARAVSRALVDAARGPGDLAFINAHGTGTPLNDVAEWRALASALGRVAGQVPVTSTKGAVGHLLGAAGAIEAVATVLSLVHGSVHPTAGVGEPDPEAPVDLVRDGTRPIERRGAAVSLNLAFGGCNAAVVFEPGSPPA